MSRVRLRAAVAVLLALGAVVFYQARYEVPVLMYHEIDYGPGSLSTRVTPDTFLRQMEFLKAHRYRVLGLEEFGELVRAGRPIPPKSVVITFDDGALNSFTNAFPILKKMDFPATLFMITSNIGKEGWLSEEDLRILDEGGVSIGSHTANHAFLPSLDAESVGFELSDSKRRLEEVLGHPVTLLSYPAGGVTPFIREQAEKIGYAAAVTTNYGKKRHDLYALHRIKASESGGSLFSFWAKVSGLYHLGKKRVVRI